MLYRFLFLFLLTISFLKLYNQIIYTKSFRKINNEYNNIKIDSSVVDNLLILSQNKINSDGKKALKYGELSYELSRYLNYERGIAMSSACLFRIYSEKGDSDIALQCIKNALNYFYKIGDTSNFLSCYYNFGLFLIMQGKDKEALKYLRNSMFLYEMLGEKNNLINCYNSIAIVHSKQSNFEFAEHYYKKSIDLCNELHDTNSLQLIYFYLGELYESKNEYLTAIMFINKSLQLANKYNNKLLQASCYSYLGIINANLKKFDKSLYYYDKALFICERFDDNYNITQIYQNIADIYFEIDEPEKAVFFSNKALKILGGFSGHKFKQFSFERLATIFEKTGNYKDALYNYKLYISYKDSVAAYETKEKITQMELDYNFENKEKEIKLLSEKNYNQALLLSIEKDKKRNQLFLLSALILIILIMAAWYYKHFKLKQNERLNAQKLLSKSEQLKAVIDAQEKERDRFARDIHDGIGQYFTALKFKLNKLENDNSIDNNNKYNEIDCLVDELYSEIRNISFNIMPQVIKIKGLLAAVEELILKIQKNSKINIEMNVFNFDLRLPEFIEVACYRIIQELLNNILKYSEATIIYISFTKSENELNIMIEDNGKGFNTNMLSKSNGYGWNNIKSRAEMINCIIDVDSRPDKNGTTVNINFPLI